MKTKRFWKPALLLAVPLVLFAIVAERNSWRPKTIVSPDMLSTTYGTLQFSPDGRYLNCASRSGIHDLLFYDTHSARVFNFSASTTSNYINFLSNNRIACGGQVYSFPGGELLAYSLKVVRVVGELSDGKTLLASQGKDWMGTLTTWTVQGGQSSPTTSPTTTVASPTALLPLPPKPTKNTERTFYLMADKRTLAIVDQKTGNNGETIFIAPRDKRWGIKFWDIETKKIRFTLPVICYGAVVSFESGICAFCTPLQANLVEVWNYKTGRQIGRIAYPNTAFINAYAPSPDGSLLAVASLSHPGIIKLWDVQTGKVIRTLETNNGSMSSAIESLTFAPDGRTLASGGNDGTVKLWRIK